MAEAARKLEAEDNVAWLHGVRLFSDVKDEVGALDFIAKLMRPEHYPRDTTILVEGEEGHEAYFLRSGTVKVFKSIANHDRFPVARLSSDDHPFFGEAALVQADRRSATIVCETDCECLLLRKDAFDRLCGERPAWALPVVLRIARVLLSRLHKTNDDMILLYRALLHEVKGD